MAKIPWHFFKIPWQFPDLEKILFFPDFSLTRGNPVMVYLHLREGLGFCVCLHKKNWIWTKICLACAYKYIISFERKPNFFACMRTQNKRSEYAITLLKRTY